jgi:FMN-dependent oxidoreductase (nitrilotriacetate monooxygenase family)
MPTMALPTMEALMANKKFHLAWFLNFTPDAWRDPFGQGGNPWDGEFYMDIARHLERACFDFVLFEDKLMVSETYRGSPEGCLRGGVIAPKHDPVPMTVAAGTVTKHLGLVATMSTLGYPPFLLARLCSTVDSLTKGRFGWNIVTSAEELAARNFGLDRLPPRELRYDMADEYVEVVNGLFDGWAPDAVILDRENGVYADHTKVKAINHVGRFYKVRGPLNTVRSPQCRPVYVQAGSSPKGRDFGAKHAAVILSPASGIADMKAFRDDIRARAEKFGRDPDSVKVIFAITPILGETEAEARDKDRRMIDSPGYIDDQLASISGITDIDFSKYDVEKPLPERLITNGEQGTLDRFQQWGSGKTLRQLVEDGLVSDLDLTGTPDQVAERMGDAMEAVGGDGFFICQPFLRSSRRYVIEIVDGLVPALQKRDLVRTEYTGKTLRENLLQF